MRKIEQEMLLAVEERRDWSKANTGVFMECAGNPYGPRAEVYLHGQHIADYWYDLKELHVDEHTLSVYPTTTTKSRLRALGANVYTRKGVTYLEKEAI
tara:strand:+ start:589 stop:882 length:294 start_codon:yes stop_codon:yes gene_type:complete